MQKTYLVLYIFNIISFLGYGISLLGTQSMVKEFERYGMSELRAPTGLIQILSGLILLCGFLEPWFVVFGCLQIAVMMATGVYVRRRVGDSFFKMFPAVFYLGLNILILGLHLVLGITLPEF